MLREFYENGNQPWNPPGLAWNIWFLLNCTGRNLRVPPPKSPPKINKALSIQGRYQYPSVSIKPGSGLDSIHRFPSRKVWKERGGRGWGAWGGLGSRKNGIPPGISWIPWDFRGRLKHDSLNTAMIASTYQFSRVTTISLFLWWEILFCGNFQTTHTTMWASGYSNSLGDWSKFLIHQNGIVNAHLQFEIWPQLMVQKQNDQHICNLNLKCSPKALGSQTESLGGEVNPETSMDFFRVHSTYTCSFILCDNGRTL